MRLFGFLISFFLLLVSLLFFVGCAAKVPQSVQSALIVFKTPKINYGDMGFVKNYGESVQLQIFSAGTALFELSVGKLICVDGRCLGKSVFNKEFLSPFYPDETIGQILLARPIFEAENLVRNEEGFEQKIFSPGRFDILYTVKKGEVSFRDRLSHIVIIIRRVE